MPRHRNLGNRVIAASEGDVFSTQSIDRGRGEVLSLDVESGEQKWRTDLDVSPRSLAVAGDGLLVSGSAANGSGRCILLDSTSGEVIREIEGGTSDRAVAIGDSVFLGGIEGLLEYRPGQKELERKVASRAKHLCTHADDIYFCRPTSSGGLELCWYSPEIGLRASAPIDASLSGVNPAPTANPGVVLVSLAQGKGVAPVDIDAGEERWRVEPGLKAAAAAWTPYGISTSLIARVFRDRGTVLLSPSSGEATPLPSRIARHRFHWWSSHRLVLSGRDGSEAFQASEGSRDDDGPTP